MILSAPFCKIVLKFDKHGLRQIGKILGLSTIIYYYNFTMSLSLLIPERTMKAYLHIKYKVAGNWQHTIKPGTPEHGTTEHGTPAKQRNTPEQGRNNGKPLGTPEEHPRTPTEHQRNTSGIPWNNETIQNEEQL